MPLIEKDVDMIWDAEAKERFQSATHCHIREKELDRSNEVIVRDGRFRGTAHEQCYLQYKIDKSKYKLPVIFHNLRGCDCHIILQKVQRRHGMIGVIPNNSERYISFTIGRLKFLDSMQFLSTSLDKLAKQLNENQFIHLNKLYPDPTHRRLLAKKGVYPYDYMNSMERFGEINLPDEERFPNRLDDKAISKEEYAHVKNGWNTFPCITMQEYHDLYLKSDVLLFADVFENFRKMALNTYHLDPIHYIYKDSLGMQC